MDMDSVEYTPGIVAGSTEEDGGPSASTVGSRDGVPTDETGPLACGNGGFGWDESTSAAGAGTDEPGLESVDCRKAAWIGLQRLNLGVSGAAVGLAAEVLFSAVGDSTAGALYDGALDSESAVSGMPDGLIGRAAASVPPADNTTGVALLDKPDRTGSTLIDGPAAWPKGCGTAWPIEDWAAWLADGHGAALSGAEVLRFAVGKLVWVAADALDESLIDGEYGKLSNRGVAVALICVCPAEVVGPCPAEADGTCPVKIVGGTAQLLPPPSTRFFTGSG
jgi:hypothetical protein